ncbi:MAG: hypothetical protein ABI577_05430 [bacterium]
MPTTATSHRMRTRWAVIYQDALGTPEDDFLDREFASEAAAMTWVNANPVVPLWMEKRDQLLGETGNILGTVRERFEF